MVKPFTHLSVASNYSFKYGVNHPEQLVARAAQLNMDSLALTDIDNLAAAVRFAQSCEAYGIAPILKAKAYQLMALSALTFPHQLVRLIFTEQLYRAFSILKNEKYHHE